MRNCNLLRFFAVPIVHVASADAAARLELVHASHERARRPAEPPALRPSTETRHLSNSSGFVLSDGCSPGEIGFEDRRSRRIAWRRCKLRLHPTFSAFLSISLARRCQPGPDARRESITSWSSRKDNIFLGLASFGRPRLRLTGAEASLIRYLGDERSGASPARTFLRPRFT